MRHRCCERRVGLTEGSRGGERRGERRGTAAREREVRTVVDGGRPGPLSRGACVRLSAQPDEAAGPDIAMPSEQQGAAAAGAQGGEAPKKKYLRNAEGEAQAQFRDEDFDFGGKKKQMIGSEGQIINLDGAAADEPQEEKKVFKARDAGTVQRQGKWMMDMLSTEYTQYKFTIIFGKQKWEIAKRFSDFDKLDNRLNDKFGLPPVGLPPKQMFGLSDPELIMERHKVLIAYLNDCLKRPVLLHSRELQDFCEMPEDVVKVVTKGK